MEGVDYLETKKGDLERLHGNKEEGENR